MLQRQLSHLKDLKLTTAKFKPLIFSMSGFTLSYTANMFILIIFYEVEVCVQIADWCTEIYFACSAILRRR
jgi:hypothetical protein